MHLSVDATDMSEPAPLMHRLGALLLDRHPATPAGGTGHEGDVRSSMSYLTAASIALGLVVAWMGLCVI